MFVHRPVQTCVDRLTPHSPVVFFNRSPRRGSPSDLLLDVTLSDRPPSPLPLLLSLVETEERQIFFLPGVQQITLDSDSELLTKPTGSVKKATGNLYKTGLSSQPSSL